MEFPAGSTPDLTARTLDEPLSKLLGQPVIVENRAGASGNIAAETVARALEDRALDLANNGSIVATRGIKLD